MFDLDVQKNIKSQNEIESHSSDSFNISVDRKLILKALSHIQNIVEKRNIIPILSNVRLIAHNGKLELTSTDMDIAASEKIVAHILDEGSLTLSAHTLYDIIRKIPDGTAITIKLSEKHNGKIDIIAGSCNFSLSYLDAGEFPSMDQGIMPFNFFLSSTELKSLIDKNRFAISTEETRYNLNGIYLHITENEQGATLNAVATDGHRLSRVILTVPEGAAKMPGIIIPKKAVIELRKILDDTEKDVNISLSETKIKFSFGEVEFITKLIDGNFPEYSALIPKNTTINMSIDKKKLTESVDRVSTITFEKTRAVKLIINSDQVEFSVVNEEQGEAQEITECKSNASKFEIGFNSRYLIDVMSVIESNTAEFSFTDSFSPAMITDKDDSSAIYVIMPMRI